MTRTSYRDNYKLVYYTRVNEFFAYEKNTGMACRIINESQKRTLMETEEVLAYDGSPLEHVLLSITRECNFKCIHCYVSAPQNCALNLIRLKTLFRELRDMGVLHVSITGGEPFMERNIFDILDMIVANDMCISSINTNGCLINKDRAKILSDYPILSGVKISLHGATSETHRALTQGGKETFELVCSALQNLNRYDVRTVVKTIMHRIAVPDLPALFSMVGGYGVSEWSLGTIVPYGRGQDNYDELVPRADRLVLALKQLSERYHSEKSGFVLNGDIVDVFLHGRYDNCTLGSPCDYFSRGAYIGADGGVRRCGWSSSVGNVNSQAMQEIWESEQMRREKHAPVDDKCLKCHYLKAGLCKPFKYVCPAIPCNDYVKELLHELEHNL